MGRRPATTPEGRESQLIALAVDLAEKQLREGNASAQVITHFLQLGSSRQKLEQQRIALETKLVKAKTDQIANQENSEKMYQEALSAMSLYKTGRAQPEDDYDDG